MRRSLSPSIVAVIAGAIVSSFAAASIHAFVTINSNAPALEAQRKLNVTAQHLQESYERLSSGLRIARAGDDAAGLAVSERMRDRLRSLRQASRNAQDGISLLQTAEGAYAEISNILVRMRELAIQSANGTLTNADRSQLDTEYTELVEELDRLLNQHVATMLSIESLEHTDGTGASPVVAALREKVITGMTSVVEDLGATLDELGELDQGEESDGEGGFDDGAEVAEYLADVVYQGGVALKSLVRDATGTVKTLQGEQKRAINEANAFLKSLSVARPSAGKASSSKKAKKTKVTFPTSKASASARGENAGSLLH